MKNATSKSSFAAISCRVWIPAGWRVVGTTLLGGGPPASLYTSADAVEFSLGKPLANGKEKGAAAARVAVAKVTMTTEKRMLAMCVRTMCGVEK